MLVQGASISKANFDRRLLSTLRDLETATIHYKSLKHGVVSNWK